MLQDTAEHLALAHHNTLKSQEVGFKFKIKVLALQMPKYARASSVMHVACGAQDDV